MLFLNGTNNIMKNQKSLALIFVTVVAGVYTFFVHAASVTPVLTYNAISNDTTYYPPPPVTPLGPANSVYTDQVFGSRTLRVTDPNTLTSVYNGGSSTSTPADISFETTSAGDVNMFNEDDSKFFVQTLGGASIPFT